MTTTNYKPMALVSDCCGSFPESQEYARASGGGLCTECREDCEYITQEEFDEKEIKEQNQDKNQQL